MGLSWTICIYVIPYERVGMCPFTLMIFFTTKTDGTQPHLSYGRFFVWNDEQSLWNQKKQPGQWVRAKSKMLLLVLVQPAENFLKSTKVETECCILNVERRENCNICSCLVLDRTIMMIWLWIDSFILSNAVISGLWTVVS